MRRDTLQRLRAELAGVTELPEAAGPLYRRSKLPRGELRGVFIVTTGVLRATHNALESFAVSGIYDGGHEGIAYWAGREMTGCTVFVQAVIPEADHSAGRVMVSELELGRSQRAARESQLGILAQVHSHPGADARHSDGDDELVLMPFENMLSIVAPHFGLTLETMADVCVHQFQDGRWVLCSTGSVKRSVQLVSDAVDLRRFE